MSRQHFTFTNLFLRSHPRDFHSSPCLLCPSQTLPSVVYHSLRKASSDSVNKGLVVCNTNILLCDTLLGVVCHCSRTLASEHNRTVGVSTSPLAICCVLAQGLSSGFCRAAVPVNTNNFPFVCFQNLFTSLLAHLLLLSTSTTDNILSVY